jgi:HlyD family secretion protein
MPNTAPIFSDNSEPRKNKSLPLIIGGGIVLLGILVLILVNFISARPQNQTTVVKSPTIAAVEKKTIRDIISVSGVLELTKKELITSPGEGIVEQVFVDIGSTLKPGDVLLKINQDDLSKTLETKKASLEKLVRETDQTKIEREYSKRQYDLEITTAQQNLADAQKELERLIKLQEKNLIPNSDVENAKKAVFSATNALEQAKLKQEQAETLFQLSMKNAQADLQQLQQEITDLQTTIEAYTVRTKRGGTVYSIEAEPGGTVKTYQELAVVAYATDVRAALDVPENRIAQVVKGQQVQIYIGSDTYPATVETIAPSATSSSSSSSSVVRVTAQFLSKPEKPTIGSSISGEIIAGTIQDALVLPRGPYLSSGNYATTYVIEDSIAKKRTTSFGIADGSYIQILSGLNEGEKVIVSDYRDFIHLDSVLVDTGKK